MIRMKRILLPTDFSEFSDVATKYACAFAEQFDAELHLLHVLEVFETTTPDFALGLALPSRISESLDLAKKELDNVLDPAWEETRTVIKAVAEGSAFLEILRYAKQQEIDLIVLGTHGRSGLVHVLMGSVAERVVRKAPCPVLTVRPEGHQFIMP